MVLTLRKPARAEAPVCLDRCATCIFTNARPVSTDRVKQMVDDCRRRDGFIPCHHFLGQHRTGLHRIVCRGFYDLDPMGATILQMGYRLGVQRFVDQDGRVVACANVPRHRVMGP